MDFLNSPNSDRLIKFSGIVGVSIILVILFMSQLVSTVESGTFHIKQAAMTGTMSAKMKPGMYPLFFGSNEVMPNSETYFFTDSKDAAEDDGNDNSIRAQFKDGSIVRISGTARIVLPTNEQDAINIVTKYGYRTYDSLRDKHILPLLRKAIRNTASLMTAQESYATKRTDFQVWAGDQLEGGMYKLIDKVKRVKVDESCIDVPAKLCEQKDEKYKVIKLNSDGTYDREPRAFIPGLVVLNLEVKKFKYSDEVNDQIAGQQDAMMTVQTAITNTKKAEQQKIEAEALGKKAVMEAQYLEEEQKVKAIVRAERDKEVAELKGNQRKNVAKLDKEAAEFTKQKLILLGQGEAKRKQLVMLADGALKQKLNAYERVNIVWANAHKERKVPTYMSGGEHGSNLDTNTSNFMQMIEIMTAKSLGLDINIKKK